MTGFGSPTDVAAAAAGHPRQACPPLVAVGGLADSGGVSIAFSSDARRRTPTTLAGRRTRTSSRRFTRRGMCRRSGASLTAADADEDALIQPVEFGGGCLDLGRRPKRVFAGVHVLTSRKPRQDLGTPMAHTARLDVQQVAPVGLQRVTDVAERGAVGQHDLPVGAGARQQRAAELGSDERPAGQGHDAAVALRPLAEIEGSTSAWLPAGRHTWGEARGGERRSWLAPPRHGDGRPGYRVVGMGLERGDLDAHPVIQRQSAE